MSVIRLAHNITVCEDTVENRAEFQRLKARILNAPGRSKSLSAQIAKENKALKQLASFTPGHEPDRFR